jgi:hypothetical protein
VIVLHPRDAGKRGVVIVEVAGVLTVRLVWAIRRFGGLGRDEDER